MRASSRVAKRSIGWTSSLFNVGKQPVTLVETLEPVQHLQVEEVSIHTYSLAGVGNAALFSPPFELLSRRLVDREHTRCARRQDEKGAAASHGVDVCEFG